LLRLGRPAEALAAMDAILKVWQKEVPARHLRAQALEALGREAEAEAEAARAAAKAVQAAVEQEAQELGWREFVPDDPPLAAFLP
jgi:hypothetical protein